MPRLFIAIDFPPPVVDRLAGLCSGLPGARWVKPDQLHLTVRFIGEVETPLFKTIRDRLSLIDQPAFTVTLQGLGHFPPRRSPRVLWVGLAPSQPLAALRRSQDAILKKCAIAPEGRKFHPHVTLARFRDRVASARLGNYLAGNNLFTTGPVPVDSFALYSSILTPKGAQHTLEARYPLTASDQ